MQQYTRIIGLLFFCLAMPGCTPGPRAISTNSEETNDVDEENPLLVWVGTPNAVTSQANSTFQFMATDSQSGIENLECKVNSAPSYTCGSPQSFAAIEGSNVFKVVATDKSGNSSSLTFNWVVDSTNPVVEITAIPNSNTNQTSANFEFTATDNGTGIQNLECKLDSSPFQNCLSSASYSSLPEGPHTFQVRATDRAGNSGLATYTWTIDPPPQVEVATVYPAPTGEIPSPNFIVEIIDDSGVPKSSFVNYNPARQVTTPGNPGTDLQTGRSFNWTTFETNKSVKVRVTRNLGSFASVVVRPLRYGITPTILSADKIEFDIQPGQKVSVEFDTSIAKYYYGGVDVVREILTIFADPKEGQSPVSNYAANEILRPSPGVYANDTTISGIVAPIVSTMGTANGKKAVVFGPGVYNIGYWQVPNNVEHIHIEGGAVVYGALDVLPLGPTPAPDDYLTKVGQFNLRPSFKLTGHGILSGRKIPWHATTDYNYCADDVCGWWKTIKLVRLSVVNTTLSDVTFADAPYWTISYSHGADTRSSGTMTGFKILSQWAHNNDGVAVPANGLVKDCFIQANDDALIVAGSNERVDNCVVWQFQNGAVAQIGWFPKTISNIQISNIDVIHGEWWWGAGDNSGLVSYGTTGGAGLISGMHFSNINMEGQILRLIGIFADNGQQFKNFSFTNIRVGAWGNDIFNSGRYNTLNALTGASVDGVTFNGLRVAGQLVTNSNYVSVGRFQWTGNVTNINFGP